MPSTLLSVLLLATSASVAAPISSGLLLMTALSASAVCRLCATIAATRSKSALGLFASKSKSLDLNAALATTRLSAELLAFGLLAMAVKSVLKVILLAIISNASVGVAALLSNAEFNPAKCNPCAPLLWVARLVSSAPDELGLFAMLINAFSDV